MKKFNPITILTLFFICFYFNVSAGIYLPTIDSTAQKTIEFTHKKKNKKAHFFKKGDQVTINKKGKKTLIRGKIEGFTKDGIIIKNQEIKIKEIKKISSQSIFNLFNFAPLRTKIAGILIFAAVLIVAGLISASAFFFALYSCLIIFGIICIWRIIPLWTRIISGDIGSIYKLKHQSFDLKEWTARIISKK